MPTQVDIPGIGIVEFPDGMTDDQISLAIKRDILKQEPTPVAAPQAAPEPPAEGFVARTSTALRDIPEAIARGYYNAKTGLNVLGLESGYLTPEEAAVNIAASTEAAKQYAMPESVRKGMEEIQNAQGWKETGLAIAKNLDVIPSVLGESISSSAVSMGTGLIGGLLGAGTGSVVPGFGTAVGATVGLSTGVGAGSAATEYASSLNQFLTSKGVNTSDPDQLKAAFSNPDLMSEARSDAATRGIAVGVFDALSAGIAGRLFAPVKKALGDKVLGTAAGTGAEIISQSGAGAAGEATAQVATEGEITSPGAVALEAVGEIVPGIGEAVISKATGARTTAESPIPPPSSLREQALVDFYKTPGATEAATDADRIATEQLAAENKAEADRLAAATPTAVVPPTTTEYGTAVPTSVSTTEQPAATQIPKTATEFGPATTTPAAAPATPAVQSDSVKLANIYIDKLTEQNRPELVNKVRAIIATNDDTIINTGLSAVDTVYDMIKSGTLDPKFVSQGKITDSQGNEVAGGYMPSTQTIRLNNLDSTSAYFDPITTAAHEAVHHLDNLATGTDFARVSESIFSPIASKWQGGKDLLSLLPRSVKSQYGKAGLEYLENQLASVPEGEKNPYEVRAYLIGARTHDRMYGTTPKNRNFIGKVLDFGSEFVERFSNKISGVGWTSAGDTLNAISSGKLSQGLMNLGIVANPQAAPQVASQTTPKKPKAVSPEAVTPETAPPTPAVEEAAVKPPVEEATTGSIPFMMTAKIRSDLAKLGYSAQDIKNMKPEDAQKILKDGTPPAVKPPAPSVTEEEVVPPKPKVEPKTETAKSKFKYDAIPKLNSSKELESITFVLPGTDERVNLFYFGSYGDQGNTINMDRSKALGEGTIFASDRYRDSRRGITRPNEMLDKLKDPNLVDIFTRFVNGEIDRNKLFYELKYTPAEETTTATPPAVKPPAPPVEREAAIAAAIDAGEYFSRASFAKDTKIPNSRNGEFFGKGITNEEAMSLTRRLGTGIKPGRIYLPEGDDTRGRAHIEKQGHIPELQDIGFNGIVDALEYVTSKRENNDFNIGGGTSYVISAIKKVNGKDVKIFAAIAPDLNDTSKHSVITLYPSTGKKPSERGATQVDRGTSERMKSLTPEQRRAMIMNKEQFSRAAAQTSANVEEFKRWWKRSKAVDTNGEPKRFYTGKATTRLDKDGKPFKSFTRAGSGVMLDAMGLPIPGMRGPFYFSPDPPFANQFAMRRLSKNDFKEKKADQVADGGRMIPVFLSVQDPFDFDNPEHVARIMQDQILKDDVLRGRIQKAFIEKGSWKEIEKTAVQGAIRRSGFDGFYLMETLPEYNDNNEPTGNSITSKNLAVYDPKQIKGVFNEFAPGTAESEQFSRTSARQFRSDEVVDWDLSDDLLAELGGYTPAKKEKKERVYRDKPVNRTRDEEYDAWSRGAAITDVNTNKPLVFYTGTSKDLIFKSFKVGRHGTWFTTDSKEASQYAEQNDSQGYKIAPSGNDPWSIIKTNTASRVIPVFLRVENPYRGDLPPEAKKDNYKKAQSEFFDTLRSQGYDAWIPPNRKTGIATNDSLVVILKDPTQIKSIFNQFKPGAAESEQFSRARALEVIPKDMISFSTLSLLYDKPNVRSGSRTLLKTGTLLRSLHDAAFGENINLQARTPANKDKIAKFIVAEALAALSVDSNAIGWYDRKLKAAKRLMALIEPEILTNKTLEAAFDTALAITSNGQAVLKNYQDALAQYRAFKQTGKFPIIGFGDAKSAMETAFEVSNNLIDRYGMERFTSFLNTEFTVRQLQDLGFNASPDELPNSKVFGSFIFGPKIGQGFYQNLRGNFDPLTMDRWFMRFWNRIVGAPFSIPSAAAPRRAKIKSMLSDLSELDRSLIDSLSMNSERDAYSTLKNININEDEDLFDNTIMSLAKRYQSYYARMSKQGGKPFKSPLMQMVGTHFKQLKGSLQEQPRGPQERQWIREVAEEARKALAKEGVDINTADLQALVWYPEKNLWTDKLGVKKGQGEDIDYSDAAEIVAKLEGIDDEVIQETRATFDGGSVDTSGDNVERADSELRGKSVSSYGQGLSDKERTKFIRQEFNRELQRLSNGKYSEDNGAFRRKRQTGDRWPVTGNKTLNLFKLGIAEKNKFERFGFSSQNIYELDPKVDAKTFLEKVTNAANNSKYGKSVTLQSLEDLSSMRLFVSEDGNYGFAINKQDIVSVFADPDTTNSASIGIMELAKQVGGRKLDAFDTILPSLYASSGFVPVARIPFDDNQAPDGWLDNNGNPEKIWQDFTGRSISDSKLAKGRPDLVFMAYDPNNTKLEYNPDEAIAVSGYEDGMAVQNSFLRSIDEEQFSRAKKPSKIVEDAKAFAAEAHANVGQLRKYTNDPYIVHPAEAVQIVSTVPHTDAMLAAAWLHDVVEDTDVTIETVREKFGGKVADLVGWLTDVSKPEQGNRAVRKAIDREHTAAAPAEAQTIKLADLISNTRSIVEYDKKFAKVYLEEKRLLLDVMTKGDATLMAEAKRMLEEGQKSLTPSDEQFSRATIVDAKSVSNFVEKNIGFDNPATSRPENGGIKWLQNKIEAAEKAMSQYGRETAAGKGLTGATTAWTPTEMDIPLNILNNVKGGWNEKPVPGDVRYDRLFKKFQEEGWNPDAIHISVNHLGVPYITHGNTRRAVANDLGKSVIPATISWFNGAENVPGEWSADGFAKQILSSSPVSEQFSRAEGRDFVNKDVPIAPGKAPIPDGHVRLYHQTNAGSIPNILKEGLTFKNAKGYEGPKAIYAGETGFYGKPEDVPTIEFSVSKERWTNPPFVRGDVEPTDIIAAHLPWHQTARYIEEDPQLLQEVLQGVHDEGVYGTNSNEEKAVKAIKEKYAATSEQFSRATAQQKAILARIQAAPTNDGVMSKFASEVYVKDGSLGSGLGGLKVRFIQGLFDYLAPLKLIAPNAYKKFRIANNSASIALSVIANGPIERFNGGYRTIPGAKSLIAIIDGIGKKYGPEGVHLWTGYMAAKRSKRLILEGRESLMTQADIDQMLDLINQYPEFETARKEWIEFNDKNVDFARANGTLTAREAASWKANGDYIPFYRALDDDGGLVAPGVGTLARQSDVSKKLKGSDKQLGNILENMILNTDLLVRKAIRNDALRSLEREAAGTGALQKISGITPTSVLTTGKSIADEIADHLSKVMGIDRTDPAFDVIVQPIIDATDMSDAGLISLFGFRPNMDKDVMVVRGPSGIPGDTSTKRYYKIKDPLLVTALTFVPPTNLGFMRLLTAPKILFTRAITMAPPFMAANLFRDTLQARVLSNANTIPFFDTTKGLYASLRNTQGAKDLQAGGGSTTNNYDSSSLNRYKKLTGSKSNPFMVALGNAWGALEAIGNATEVANRIAIREAKLKSGASLGDANFEALDIMDFSLRGSNVIVNFIISTVPFMNARLQGMYKLGRAGFSKENRANFLLMGSMFALASLGLAAMNEDDERYQEETDVSKDNYIHIYLDKFLPKEALIAAGIDKWTKDFHLALPKPFEIGAVFMTIPERMYNVYKGTQQAKDLRDSVWGIVGTTFKMHPVEMIPYPAKIAAEQVMNVDLFRKRDIVPENKRAPGAEEAEYEYNTPEVLKAFSQAVKDNTGVGISPLRAEKLIRDFAGTFGEYFIMAGDMAYREMNGMPQPINKSLLESVTGQSRFVKTNSPTYTKHEQDFYNLSKDIKSIVRVLDTFDKENPEKAAKFEEANRAYIDAEKEANNVSAKLSKLRRAKEEIYREGGPDAEAEIKDINAEENELTKEFMVYFRELEAEY